MSVFTKLAPYSKFVVALGGAVVVTGQVVADGTVHTDEAFLVLTAWSTAVGVFLKRNAPA